MKQQLAGAALLLSLVTAAACGGSGATRRTASMPPYSTVPSPAESRESLRAADAALAEAMATRGSAEALGASSGDSALLLLKGVYTLRSREALHGYLTAHPLEEGGTLRAQTVRWDVSEDGLMGYTVGQATLEGGAGPKPRYLRYLAVWTRPPEGTWRVVAAVYNPAPGPFEVPASHPQFGKGAPPSNPVLPADTLAQAFAADRAFSDMSLAEGMGAAFTSWATEDAMLSGAGLFGREAIAKANASLTRDKVELRWEPRLGGAAISGELAYTVGLAVSVVPGPDGKPVTNHVKYLTVWRRQPDGEWRWVADQGNGNPGPDGP